MLRQCLFATLWCFSALLGAADHAGMQANLVHFETLYRKDSALGIRLVKSFERAFSQVGYQFVVEHFPARRGTEELKHKRVDGTVGRVDNLVTLYGITDYIRIDVPLIYTTMSLWCNKDAKGMKNLKNPRVAYTHSSTFATRIAKRIEDKSVLVSAVNSYRNMLVMMRRDRLDCLIATTTNMDTEQIGPEHLQGVFRHDLVTLPAYAWIAKKFQSWIPIVKKELQQLVADKDWKKLYMEERARCGESFENLCPDGRIFARQVKVQDEIMVSSSSN